jgi:acyl carrier protein phosphodiesterase
MSQDLYFYKQKIIPQKIAKCFTSEEVHSSIKALLKNRYLEQQEALRDNLFEEVEVYSFTISAYNQEIEELLKETEFIPSKSRRFMMNEKIWSAIKIIVDSKIAALQNIKRSQSKNDAKYGEISRDISQLKKDYKKLEKLFNNNLLFVNLQ